MNWARVMEFISNLTKMPSSVLIATVMALFILFSGIGIGFGRAFRDLPLYIFLTILSVLNFILSIIKRPQINCQIRPFSEERKMTEGTSLIDSVLPRQKTEKVIKLKKKRK